MINKIWKIARQVTKEDLYYRFDVLLYVCNFIIQITVYIFIWLAIYNNGNQVLGMNFEQITTYYVLPITLNPIIFWGINESIGEHIREGEVQKQLLFPISYFNWNFGIKIGVVLESCVVGGITFVICLCLFGVLPPAGIINFLFFIILICLSVVVIYLLEMILGMAAFYTNSLWGVEVFKRAVLNIFTGMIAPITLFPEFLQKIANVLPFKECVYTPISIYFGELSQNEILHVILKQCIWIVILYIIAKIVFKKAIKNITINGG